MHTIVAFASRLISLLTGDANATASIVSQEADQLTAVVKRFTQGMQQR